MRKRKDHIGYRFSCEEGEVIQVLHFAKRCRTLGQDRSEEEDVTQKEEGNRNGRMVTRIGHA